MLTFAPLFRVGNWIMLPAFHLGTSDIFIAPFQVAGIALILADIDVASRFAERSRHRRSGRGGGGLTMQSTRGDA